MIKIERPGTGDDTRAWAPPYLKDAEGRDTTESAYYLACNRGKLSVAIDFTQPEGRDLVVALARQADVLVENFKVGGLAKYGLDYASVAASHPRLVYCSITGFGQDGPYADRAGYDFIIQGMSGFMSVTGERDDLPGGGPQKAGIANDSQFAKFCEIAGRPEWARDPRYSTNAERVRRRDEIVPLIAAVMRSRTQRDWLEALEAQSVPCGPINTLDQVFVDPQTVARGLRVDLPHPLAGRVPQVATPIRYDGATPACERAPPLLGADTRTVLSERLSLDAPTIDALVARGVVQCSEDAP